MFSEPSGTASKAIPRRRRERTQSRCFQSCGTLLNNIARAIRQRLGFLKDLTFVRLTLPHSEVRESSLLSRAAVLSGTAGTRYTVDLLPGFTRQAYETESFKH